MSPYPSHRWRSYGLVICFLFSCRHGGQKRGWTALVPGGLAEESWSCEQGAVAAGRTYGCFHPSIFNAIFFPSWATTNIIDAEVHFTQQQQQRLGVLYDLQMIKMCNHDTWDTETRYKYDSLFYFLGWDHKVHPLLFSFLSSLFLFILLPESSHLCFTALWRCHLPLWRVVLMPPQHARAEMSGFIRTVSRANQPPPLVRSDMLFFKGQGPISEDGLTVSPLLLSLSIYLSLPISISISLALCYLWVGCTSIRFPNTSSGFIAEQFPFLLILLHLFLACF